MKTATDIETKEIDDFYILIGKNVKKKRMQKSLTQLQLSLSMNFKSVGLIAQAEIYTNKQHFNIKHLYQIAYILECDIEDFFKPL